MPKKFWDKHHQIASQRYIDLKNNKYLSNKGSKLFWFLSLYYKHYSHMKFLTTRVCACIKYYQNKMSKDMWIYINTSEKQNKNRNYWLGNKYDNKDVKSFV